MDVQIGKITHYYDKIGVAVMLVTNQQLKAGDLVKFSGHDNEFTQEVDSLQMEHKQVTQVDPGETVGVKVQKPVKAGDIVYLATKR